MRYAAAQVEIVAEQRTVVGVCAVVDNGFSTLDWVFSTQVGYALIGDEDVHRVLAVVHVGHHRHYVGYAAAF